MSATGLPEIGENLRKCVILVCNSSFQISTLGKKLSFRRGVLLGYKEKGKLVKIVRLLMS